MLVMQHPVGVGDRIDLEEAVRAALFLQLGANGEQPNAVYAPIHHHMAYTDPLRTKLACDALRRGS